MTREELTALLKSHEWRDVEFKEAQSAVPSRAYETVSAFANTEGGHLVFGVRQNGQDIEIVGVLDVDKVQNEFLSALRQRDKISLVMEVGAELHNLRGADLLVFHVPEVHRSDKPVYLNGDIRRSFVRSGGSNVRCSKSERNRFLMDAATERYDGQALELNLQTAFDAESIKWYRATYEGRPGNRSYATLSDVDFLEQMGLLVEYAGDRLPTRAAILLFGTNPKFRQLLSRPVVDCQRYRSRREMADTGERWFDRLVLEENLIRTWRALMDDWYSKVAEHPFGVDAATLQRNDTPPDNLAYREATVNMVVHQDYAEQGRKAVIRHYPDQTVFWNPGDAFATDIDLLEPGEKEVRNPKLALAFRRIGLSENAGWGLRDVFRNWQQLGNVPPSIANDKQRKSFELALVKEELVSEQQLARQASMGLRLTDAQTRAFAFACREREVGLVQIKVVTDLPPPEAVAVATELVEQALLEEARPGYYRLAAHLRGQLAATDQVAPAMPDLVTDPTGRPKADLVTDGGDQVDIGNMSTAQVAQRPDLMSTEHVQAGMDIDQVTPAKPDLTTDQVSRPKTDLATDRVFELSDQQRRIMAACDTSKSLTELMALIGLKHRSFFRSRHLKPLLVANIVRMTNPDHPNAANQRYILTEAGLKLRAMHLETRPEEGQHGQD